MSRQGKVIFLAFIFSLAVNAQDKNEDKSKKVDGESKPLVSKDGKTTFAKAQPEDITNENFPNLIESFDYPNADISEVVKAISKLTGKNFILEKGVAGKISIIAPSQITVAEAYKAFLTALAMNGYTVVPSGNFLKIRTIQNAITERIDTYAGNYFPNSDMLITRIVKLQFINAEELQKTLRPLTNRQGDITPYAPTNSLIITDYGSNVERIMNILNQLDVPGFEEKLVVIPIRYARAKDIAELIDQIINKDSKNSRGAGVPRFRRGRSSQESQQGGSGAATYSQVIPDLRTNSIIVVGNEAGIRRIRGLVAQLDFKLRPEDAGGVYVYYVRHGEAEKIANVLNGIASESTKAQTSTTKGSAKGGSANNAIQQAVFGGDVKVAADKDNNSLIVTAGKQDYDVVKSLLAKIDIPRDQVHVKAIIMEMTAGDTINWGVNYYKFKDGTDGAGRAGFVTTDSVSSLLSPTGDEGLVLGFGSSDIIELDLGTAGTFSTPSLVGLINFFKSKTNTNVLSSPEITALDNEEAEIIVGEEVPVQPKTVVNDGVSTQDFERKEVELKLTLTPYISPDTDTVRMKIEQLIEGLSNREAVTTAGGGSAISTTKRSIKTNIIVNSNDTAVLGGLYSDTETESIKKVPILGDIPIIGWLFKGKNNQKQKTNLLVFITPKIIRNTQDSSDLLNKKLNERIDFIQQSMRGRDPYGYEVDNLPRRDLVENQTQEFISTPPLESEAPLEDLPEQVPQTEEPPSDLYNVEDVE